jgi:hypothetical protein
MTEKKTDGQEQLFGEPLDLIAEKQRIDAERSAMGRYFKLQDGEMAQMDFTGKIFRATNTFGNESVYFELEGTNDKDEHKLFAVGAKSGIVPKLIEQLIDGNLHLTLMRAGSGTQTQYTIVKQKK